MVPDFCQNGGADGRWFFKNGGADGRWFDKNGGADGRWFDSKMDFWNLLEDFCQTIFHQLLHFLTKMEELMDQLLHGLKKWRS